MLQVLTFVQLICTQAPNQNDWTGIKLPSKVKYVNSFTVYGEEIYILDDTHTLWYKKDMGDLRNQQDDWILKPHIQFTTINVAPDMLGGITLNGTFMAFNYKTKEMENPFLGDVATQSSISSVDYFCALVHPKLKSGRARSSSAQSSVKCQFGHGTEIQTLESKVQFIQIQYFHNVDDRMLIFALGIDGKIYVWTDGGWVATENEKIYSQFHIAAYKKDDFIVYGVEKSENTRVLS
eukprot:NODE_152_length_15391_cov_0.883272.p8 type:complete len:236 gc:universal NODE_152_length_15391_cov_0.883272:8077-8784(+)